MNDLYFCKFFIPFFFILTTSITVHSQVDKQTRDQQLSKNRVDQNSVALAVHQELKVKLRIKTTGETYVIDWGDGTEITAASNILYTHDYASTFTGKIKIKNLNGTHVREIVTHGQFIFNTAKIFDYAPLVELCDFKDGCLIYGNLSNMPYSIRFFNCDRGRLYGDLTEQLNQSNFKRLRTVIGSKIELNWDRLPLSTNYIGVTGNSKIYGKLQIGWPTAPTHIDIQGESNVSGDLGLCGNMPIILNLSGQCSVNAYTPKKNGGNLNFLNPNAKKIIIAGESCLTTTEIDNLLIDLDSETSGWANSGNIIIKAGSSRSSNSDAAVISLEAKGATVTIIE